MVASQLHLYYLRSPRMQIARLEVGDAALELTVIRYDHPSSVHLLSRLWCYISSRCSENPGLRYYSR